MNGFIKPLKPLHSIYPIKSAFFTTQYTKIVSL
jgi:hypothetical protein